MKEKYWKLTGLESNIMCLSLVLKHRIAAFWVVGGVGREWNGIVELRRSYPCPQIPHPWTSSQVTIASELNYNITLIHKSIDKWALFRVVFYGRLFCKYPRICPQRFPTVWTTPQPGPKIKNGWWIDWLMDWLIDWLVGWLIDWLIDWLIGWWIDW